MTQTLAFRLEAVAPQGDGGGAGGAPAAIEFPLVSAAAAVRVPALS